MNWTSRWLARTGSGFAAGLSAALALNAALLCAAAPASAQSAKNFWFVGTNLIFAKAQQRGADTAVASDDPGLTRFLTKLGATLAYDPGQRYIIITSGDRRTITFTLGDTRFSNGSSTETAAFAPYQANGAAYLPFLELARALYVLPVDDPQATILQPQLGGLDVRNQNGQTLVALRGALPMKFQRLSQPDDERVQVAFTGLATTLDAQRTLATGTLRGVTIELSGSPRNPTTTVTFDSAPGSAHALAPSRSGNELLVAFGPRGVALGAPIPVAGDATSGSYANALRASPPPPRPLAQAPQSTQTTNEYAPLPGDVPVQDAYPAPPLHPPAQVTAFDSQALDDAFTVHVAVSGPVTFEWHRLPDNRWYIDLKDATLAVPARDDQPHSSAVDSLRLKQLSPAPDSVVRIALSLNSPREVDIVPAPGGFTLAVSAQDDSTGQKVGLGRISAGAVLASAPAPTTPDLWSSAPPVQQSRPPQPVPGSSHPYVATNPRLIVIDPGHGGSDVGAAHNGLVEKDLNLDISKRLRTLLIARGWQVKMTRETDIDVYQPNDSAHDELQARCDIANNAGARMFVSVHINSFTSSELDGTTTYYYKSSDLGLAQAVHRRLAGSLSTADRGTRKENFYVIHHTDMPAVLVETAFLSNPGDAALLRSPGFLQRVAAGIADGIGDFAANAPQVSSSPDDGS